MHSHSNSLMATYTQIMFVCVVCVDENVPDVAQWAHPHCTGLDWLHYSATLVLPTKTNALKSPNQILNKWWHKRESSPKNEFSFLLTFFCRTQKNIFSEKSLSVFLSIQCKSRGSNVVWTHLQICIYGF